MRLQFTNLQFEAQAQPEDKGPGPFRSTGANLDDLLELLGGSKELLGEVMHNAIENAQDDQQRQAELANMNDYLSENRLKSVEVMQGYNNAATQGYTDDLDWDIYKTPFDNVVSLSIIEVDKQQENYISGDSTVPVNAFAAKAIIAQTPTVHGTQLNEEILGLPNVMDYMPYFKSSTQRLTPTEELVVETYLESMEKFYKGSYQILEDQPYKEFCVKYQQYADSAYEWGSGTLLVAKGLLNPRQFPQLAEHLLETGYRLPINLITLEDYAEMQVDWEELLQSVELWDNEPPHSHTSQSPLINGGNNSIKGRSSDLHRQKRYNGQPVRQNYHQKESLGRYTVMRIMDPWVKTGGRMSTLPKSNATKFWRDGVDYITSDTLIEIKTAVQSSEEALRRQGPAAMYHLARIIDEADIKWHHFDMGHVNPLELAIIAFMKRPSWGKVWKAVGKNYTFNLL